MLKKIIIFLSLLLLIPQNIPAEKLIISGKKINETIIRDHFSLPVDELIINMEKLNMLLERLENQTYKSPVNAKIDDQGDIVPAISGEKLDRKQFIHLFYTFYYNRSLDKMEIPRKKIYAKVDSELLAEIRTNEIGSYLTYYKESNQERSHNIVLAAEAINNHVVFPGEEFSFNKVVGKRTEEKGYKRAPVIVKGELTEDIGGGICQVSSTLFNAVNLQGVEMIERYSHSRSVPYVPPGKDATVSWWGPDFVFKNKYNQPLLIQAQARHGTMHIQIYSSDGLEIKTDQD